MKVSFLVTYYNQHDYVSQSLNSILKTEKPCDWEILVGDDGSTDSTTDEVQRYVKQYPDNIRCFVMPRDSNVRYDSVLRASANRLNLLDHADGDYFMMLDGDDYYTDVGFLFDALAVLNTRDDISVVAFNYKEYTDGKSGSVKGIPSVLDNSVIPKTEYIKNYYTHAGACVYRRQKALDAYESARRTGYYDDNDIVIHSLCYGDMFFINKCIYAYRQTQGSVFNSMDMLEQDVLNTLGMDAEMSMTGGLFDSALVYRYSDPLLALYRNRYSVSDKLDKVKVERYIKGSKSLERSACRVLLDYRSSDASERAYIKSLIRSVPFRRALIQFVLGVKRRIKRAGTDN